MPALVANALNKRVMNLFQEYPKWWEKIVSIEDFSILQDARWITLGGVGELPTVAEGRSLYRADLGGPGRAVDIREKGRFPGDHAGSDGQGRHPQAASRAESPGTGSLAVSE
jgi:hypothetical protein